MERSMLRTTMTLLGLLLGLTLTSGVAWADACDPGQAANDADQDGLTNAEECPPGLVADGVNASLTIPSCRDSGPPCLDPDRKDLFVVVVKDSSNTFGRSALDEPAHAVALGDLFAPMEASSSGGGLDLQVHVVTSTPSLPLCLRCVTPQQAAIAINENRDERANDCPRNPPPWGETDWGNANEFGTGIVYTQRILDGIDCFLASASGLDGDQLKQAQLVNSFNHEAAHLMRLAEEDDRKVGHHYAQGSNCFVDVAPVYEVDRKGNATVTVGNSFCGPSRATIELGATAEGSGVICGDFTNEDFELSGPPTRDCAPTQ
jgi:hypothetical protein